jgi:magnesium chelatase family protein
MSYMAKLSGPLMDRIDLQLIMKPIDPKTMMRKRPAESTAEIAERVRKARERQKERLASEEVFCNAGMNNRMIEKYCNLDSRCSSLLEKLIDKAGFSARACSRIIKLARTIADLEGAESIMPEHIAEAAGYRILDKLG